MGLTLRTTVLALWLVVGCVYAGHGQEARFPKRPTNYVTDPSGILTDDEQAALNAQLKAYEDSTTNQYFIFLVRGLEGRSGDILTNDVFRAWGVGQKGKDNGVLIVLALEDRFLRIEVGYGLEGAVPDALTARIREEIMNPLLREGRYADALAAGARAVHALARGAATDEVLPPRSTLPFGFNPHSALHWAVAIHLGLGALGGFFCALVHQIGILRFVAGGKLKRQPKKRSLWVGRVAGAVLGLLVLPCINGAWWAIFPLIGPGFAVLFFARPRWFLRKYYGKRGGGDDSSDSSSYDSGYSGGGYDSDSSSSSSDFGGGGGGDSGGGGSSGHW
ncbi:MAG: TPM domain-containing protein [Bacteroidia bacterium]|nr:TPM domain-containing protein [Bacteroidia bacterium]